MNDTATSASGMSLLPDSTDMITGIHIGIMAVLALLAIAVIVWGARLKRQRKAAEAELRAHNEDLAGPAAEAETSDDGTARPAVTAPPAPPPVAPAPPPSADAPVLATPPVEAPAPAPTTQPDSPATVTTPAPTTATAAADPAAGPVTLLKGLGPKVATRLADLGITNVGQLAALDADAAARLDTDLAPFSGRMARDRWIEQARLLAAGDKAGFEAIFGRL